MMTRSSLLILALSTSATAFAGTGGPPLHLTVFGIEAGRDASIRVEGAAPGATVYVLYSMSGAGAGPCRDIIGGQCLGIENRVRFLGNGVADGDGTANLELPVPMAMGGRTVAFQAVMLDGPATRLSDVETATEADLPDTLSWDIAGLEDLGPDYVYEGWLIVEGAPVSTGRFSVDMLGVPTLSDHPLTTRAASLGEAFILTIEPAFMDDPAPADTHLVAGDLAGGTADLTVGHPAALGDDFTAATGAYFLQTPTTAAIADDYNQGLWFLDPGQGVASLDLPPLPAGWAYEGWVVDQFGPISTGRFTDPGAPDDDGAGPTAGPDAPPAFPGQDFINPPIDLIGTTVVISVEPEPDNSPAPFTLKPLVHGAVIDTGAGVLQDMDNNATATNPIGTAWLQ